MTRSAKSIRRSARSGQVFKGEASRCSAEVEHLIAKPRRYSPVRTCPARATSSRQNMEPAPSPYILSSPSSRSCLTYGLRVTVHKPQCEACRVNFHAQNISSSESVVYIAVLQCGCVLPAQTCTTVYSTALDRCTQPQPLAQPSSVSASSTYSCITPHLLQQLILHRHKVIKLSPSQPRAMLHANTASSLVTPAEPGMPLTDPGTRFAELDVGSARTRCPAASPWYCTRSRPCHRCGRNMRRC
jgi:hypothetical protein